MIYRPIIEQWRSKHPAESKPGQVQGGYQIGLLFVIAGCGFGWDHVSVSARNRVPSWNEMTYIKSLFWDDEETVVQFHPKKSEYVNNHPYCLHLWKPHNQEIVLPPRFMV